MLKIIHNLYRYANAKSCVRVGHMKSESFASNIEVQQGENLSPLVFCLFANDLSEFISLHTMVLVIFQKSPNFC